MVNFKERVLEVINKALKHWCYIGKYDVLRDEEHFTLKLYLNQPEAPLCLHYWGDEAGFLEFVEKEIRSRGIQNTKYYTAIQTDPGNDFIHVAINE